MDLLPPRLRRFFQRKQREQNRRVFSLDDQLAVTLTEIAKREQREEDQVFDDIFKAGLKHIKTGEDKYRDIFEKLPTLTQDITVLLCLDYSSYQISETLSVSYDTVRYHSKKIYKEFGLDRAELRNALKHWDLAGWWEYYHG